MSTARSVPSAWRRDVLRTNLWLVPTIEVGIAVALFAITYSVDQAAFHGHLTLPGWIDEGSVTAAREILTAIAAAVITVVGLVFSITIVALTLASTQFGPRMLRNFIRDRGTQLTLGTFVATFVYAILSLGAISHDETSFVPHLCITTALALVLASLGVLIYFIHHVAKSIQLPEVIAGIGQDLAVAIDTEASVAPPAVGPTGPSRAELLDRLERNSAPVPAPTTGYLQFVAHGTLVSIASEANAVIQLLFRPGHFVVEGRPLARVWPPTAAPVVTARLAGAHLTGAHRTLVQDLTFPIDQLVEIAIRALSPAVNDTFTALTCIDWLSDGLSKITSAPAAGPDHRDASGQIRVIAAVVPYERYVDRSFDKIRQASRGMPAVMIRQLDSLANVWACTSDDAQRAALRRQADMILRASEESVPEPNDRADVARHHARLAAS